MCVFWVSSLEEPLTLVVIKVIFQALTSRKSSEFARIIYESFHTHWNQRSLFLSKYSIWMKQENNFAFSCLSNWKSKEEFGYLESLKYVYVCDFLAQIWIWVPMWFSKRKKSWKEREKEKGESLGLWNIQLSHQRGKGLLLSNVQNVSKALKVSSLRSGPLLQDPWGWW